MTMAAARPLTGRKVLIISTVAFLFVLGPNLALTYYAVHTFSGLVVDNSYVASQRFDDQRRAQEALGWTLALREEGDVLRLDLTDREGRAVRPQALNVVVGRPTSDRTDRRLDLVETPRGYAAVAPLEPGNWLVMIDAVGPDGVAYSRREPLTIRGADR
jgi:nitrogen fixation protein FixH